MSVKMRTTCTWTERPYEASLFPGIGFGLFLRSLGGGQRRPPSGGARAIRYSGEQISSGDDGVGPVAQRIRARGYEPRCRGFESLLAHNRPKKGRIFPSGGRKIMIGLADPKLWNL
ncbi:hypothetical protein JHK87_051894 [Glycine soja]|nr:hypothetical protein JHK87_051894 [Glycine soja]